MPDPVPFEIREMIPKLLPQILDIAQATYPSPWSYEAFLKEATSDQSITMVAMQEQKVIGYLVAWIMVDHIHVANIAVADDYRRQGAGNQMMEWMLSESAGMGCNASTLEVRASNQPARSMYRRLGFHPVGVRKAYYARPTEDAVVLLKQIE